MPTMRQIAINELRNATKDYILALADLADNDKSKTKFVIASLRLHIARGADIPRACLRESRKTIMNARKTMSR